MGGLCPRGTPKVDPQPESKPSYNYIVRGNFIPQQNGDLKVHEEQSSIYGSMRSTSGLDDTGDWVDFLISTLVRFW